MFELSNSEAAMMGLLSEKPMHPYQIEKEVYQRSMDYWTDISQSAIYKTLRRLEDEGYVESRREITDENRVRKVYELTDEGESVLRAKIRNLISEPENVKWQIYIAINNLHLLEKEQAILCLEDYYNKLKKLHSEYGDLEKYLSDHNCPPFRMALAKRPRYLMEADMKWIKDYIEEIRSDDRLE